MSHVLKDGYYEKDAMEVTTLTQGEQGEESFVGCHSGSRITNHVFAVGNQGGKVILFSLISPYTKTELSGSHTAPILHLGRKENWITTSSSDKTVKVWDVGTSSLAFTLEGHTDAVNWSDISVEDRLLISASVDKSVRIWDLRMASCLASLVGHKDAVSVTKFHNPTYLLSAGEDATVRVWDIRKLQPLHTLHGHTAPILTLESVRGGEAYTHSSTVGSVYTSSVDGSVRVWDVGLGSAKKVLTVGGSVGCMKVIPKKNLLVTGSSDSTVKMWKLDAGDQIKTLRGHRSAVCSLEVLENETIVSGGQNGEIRIWDGKKKKCVRVLQGHSGPVECVGSNPNVYFPQIVSVGGAGEVRLWQYHQMPSEKGKKEALLPFK
eukprot:CAMPEP_0201520062 /NCGR_PEP_ID=MMETSP0161_2-20130828/10465_1 /ASSEMBLY_ACC=CAM_ASM_000251 /TAXON_ID=180227 /ORGANISM="Neoparamoeba aestuarina, Strain SoJaBio B1-5/56/2" /LENGTH=376 /DNA_ID=CAMNT_0047918311 /DNA_START=183 /DNA_END=1313 /DNA_ORIENTATION=+